MRSMMSFLQRVSTATPTAAPTAAPGQKDVEPEDPAVLQRKQMQAAKKPRMSIDEMRALRAGMDGRM